MCILEQMMNIDYWCFAPHFFFRKCLHHHQYFHLWIHLIVSILSCISWWNFSVFWESELMDTCQYVLNVLINLNQIDHARYLFGMLETLLEAVRWNLHRWTICGSRTVDRTTALEIKISDPLRAWTISSCLESSDYGFMWLFTEY